MSDLVGLWPEDFAAAVQPGVTREGLNAALRGSGLWFPVDPGAGTHSPHRFGQDGDGQESTFYPYLQMRPYVGCVPQGPVEQTLSGISDNLMERMMTLTRYGTMKENCINLEVVLADGKVIETAGHGARPRWKVSHSQIEDFSFAGKRLLASTSLNSFLAARGHLE